MTKTAYYIIIALVILIAAALYGKFAPPAKSSPPTYTGDPAMAQAVCQKAARAELKAPTTAQFGQVTPDSLGGGRYRVAGPVDAQNSYGVPLRMNYDCTVLFTGGDAYRIEHVAVSEP